MTQEIWFNPGGNYTAAGVLALLPLIVLALARKMRLEGKGTGRWEITGKYAYPLIAVPLILYFGILYWWLFQGQFYRLVIRDSGVWTLDYRMPNRSRELAVEEITNIRAVSGGMRTYRMSRICLTTSGGEYCSAQFAPGNTEKYLRLLERMKKQGASGATKQ